MLKMLADAGTELSARVDVDSCGTAAYHVGDAPDARTIAHARKRGYDLGPLRARVLTDADFMLFDRIYAMDQNNLRSLQRVAPREQHPKLALLLDVLGPHGREVPDPWAGGPEDFELVLDLVESACGHLVKSL